MADGRRDGRPLRLETNGSGACRREPLADDRGLLIRRVIPMPRSPPRSRCGNPPVRRPAVERLEGRTLFAGYAAATASELVAAINAANGSAAADTITLAA